MRSSVVRRCLHGVFAALVALLGACGSDESALLGSVCAQDSDCEPGERCNTNEDRCQALESAAQGEPCAVDLHCADDLVCVGAACSVDAYAPCVPDGGACGGEWTCLASPSASAGVCAVECSVDDECRGFDSYFVMLGLGDDALRCQPVPIEPPTSYCGVPCDAVEDCGSVSGAFEYEGATYSPACDAVTRLCTWLPAE
jgi:hypothetical protein